MENQKPSFKIKIQYTPGIAISILSIHTYGIAIGLSLPIIFINNNVVKFEKSGPVNVAPATIVGYNSLYLTSAESSGLS
jgi:hypothetical protein